MSMIIVSVNRDQAIQFSDRRVTLSNGHCEDTLNKAFILICENARLAVSFVGYAGSVNKNEYDTYRWIGETLIKSMGHECLIEAALLKFTDFATGKFREFQSIDDTTRRLSIVFSGYKYAGNEVYPVCYLVSNYDSLEEREESTFAQENFNISSVISRNLSRDLALVLPAGDTSAISEEQLQSLQMTTLKNSREYIISKGVSLINFASSSVLSHKSISPDVSVCIIPVDPVLPAETLYFPDKQTSTIFNPGSLICKKGAKVFFGDSEVHFGAKPFI